jgi:hypothetical protein
MSRLETIFVGIFMTLVCYGSGIVCIFPLKQSIEEKHKPTVYFSIGCMIVMHTLGTALFIRTLFY